MQSRILSFCNVYNILFITHLKIMYWILLWFSRFLILLVEKKNTFNSKGNYVLSVALLTMGGQDYNFMKDSLKLCKLYIEVLSYVVENPFDFPSLSCGKTILLIYYILQIYKCICSLASLLTGFNICLFPLRVK